MRVFWILALLLLAGCAGPSDGGDDHSSTTSISSSTVDESVTPPPQGPTHRFTELACEIPAWMKGRYDAPSDRNITLEEEKLLQHYRALNVQILDSWVEYGVGTGETCDVDTTGWVFELRIQGSEAALRQDGWTRL